MPPDEDVHNDTVLAKALPFSESDLPVVMTPRTPRHQRGARSKTKPPPNNTPIVRTTNSARDLFLEQDAGARQERFDSEFRRWCVGPMPMEMFLEEFLPSNATKRHSKNEENEFESVPIPGIKDGETVMYKPLV